MSIPWLRLYTETLSDRKIKLISVELDLPKPLIIGVWVSLLMLAGESPDRGRLISSRGKAWPQDFICDEIGLDIKTFSQIMTEFIAFDMVFIDDGGVICITKWDERQFKSDNSYDRVKKFRARQTKKDDEVEGNVIDNTSDYTKRNVSRNDNETFQETDQIQNTDTDTEQDSKKAEPPSMPQIIPSFQVYVEETGYYSLNKPQRRIIDKEVGDDPASLDRWREVVRTWILCGYKPINAKGMLDWFKNGIPDNVKGQENGRKQQRSNQPTNPAGASDAHQPGYILDQLPSVNIYTGEIVPPVDPQ